MQAVPLAVHDSVAPVVGERVHIHHTRMDMTLITHTPMVRVSVRVRNVRRLGHTTVPAQVAVMSMWKGASREVYIVHMHTIIHVHTMYVQRVTSTVASAVS